MRIKRYNRTYTTEPRRQFLAYLLSPEELFARSYEQYIELRSGNRAIRDQLKRERDNKLYLGTYWTDEDFGPIARAIEKAFDQIMPSKEVQLCKIQDSVGEYSVFTPVRSLRS